jgi:type I restriction enzyme, S subunit
MAAEFAATTFQELIDEGVLEIGDGYRAQNDELGGDGPIFLRAGHVTDTHVDFSGVERFHSHLADRVAGKMRRAGDTVVTTKGNSTGRTSFVTSTMPLFVYSPHLSFWRSRDPNRLDGGFVRYWSRGREFGDQLAGMKASTDMAPYLSLTDQRRLQITLPPLTEQKRIAHVLGTLDDKIELNRRMNATLEAMSRAIFKSWFVDFDPVRQKAAGKQPVGMDAQTAALFPDSFEDSEIGEVPKGWKIAALEDVLEEIETGGRPKGGVSGYTSGVPSIGAESIVGLGAFDYAKTKFVPREFYDKMTKGRVRSRDVLLYKDGGRPGQFEPHVTLFGDRFPFAECAINEHVYRLRVRADFGQSLLYFWLSSDRVMEEMRTKGTGVAIPGLNSTQAKSLTTLRPSPEAARAFNEQVEPAIARVLSNCNESRSLALLRDTLLPKLLSGEVRVPDAEGMVEEAVG